MNNNNFDQEWFFNCMLLAQNELLESTPLPLNYQMVIKRAKKIYKEGYEAKIKSFLKPESETVVKENVNEPIVSAVKKDGDYKLCPGCEEMIPVGWNKHSRKKDGTKC